MPPLLLPSLCYDRAAIMRAAHAEARATLARHARDGGRPWPYALALKHALAATWSDARTHRYCAEAEACYEAAAADERRVLDLRQARTLTSFTDSTREMIRQQAAIDAQLAHIRAAA